MQERSPLVTRVVVSALMVSLTSSLTATASSAPRARADRTWMANGRVHALVRAGDLLLIGGRFTKLLPPRGSRKEPVTVDNLAAIDLSTGKPVRSWRPRVPGTDATIYALAVSGGTVYVGGRFDRQALGRGRVRQDRGSRATEPGQLLDLTDAPVVRRSARRARTARTGSGTGSEARPRACGSRRRRPCRT
jgi:hypothetical protein